jgi:hypothetical protein
VQQEEQHGREGVEQEEEKREESYRRLWRELTRKQENKYSEQLQMNAHQVSLPLGDVRQVPMIAGQDLSISLSQACEQCSLVSEGDSEGDVVKLVHLLLWRSRLSVQGTEETCRAIIAIPNTLKEDVLAGGAD